jgi:putative ABC transport system permease protein
VILPGYLDAMGTRLVAGRHLRSTDVASSERVITIDQAFADRYFSARDPIGESILLDGPPDEDPLTARIVGVTETIRQASLEAEPRPTFYVTLSQALEGHASNWGMDMVIRSRAGDVNAQMIRSAALDFFPDAAVFRIQRMGDLVSASFAGRRLQLLLFGAFASLALALTLVGVFGVLALHVRERAREFGIRVAVGATPWRIRWTVERNALSCVAWGSAIGLTIAAVGGRTFESLVYGISVYDPIAFVGGPVALALVALAGGLVPAWTATRSDPAEVLRSDS